MMFSTHYNPVPRQAFHCHPFYLNNWSSLHKMLLTQRFPQTLVCTIDGHVRWFEYVKMFYIWRSQFLKVLKLFCLMRWSVRLSWKFGRYSVTFCLWLKIYLGVSFGHYWWCHSRYIPGDSRNIYVASCSHLMRCATCYEIVIYNTSGGRFGL